MDRAVSIRQHTPAYASIRQHASGIRAQLMDRAVSTRQHTSAHVSMRRAYVVVYLLADDGSGDGLRVSIRDQHTSAYASIRQHTSASVSMRQYTCSQFMALIRQHPSAYLLAVDGSGSGLRVGIGDEGHLRFDHLYVSMRQHTSAYVSA
jgi:hypothetical protein